MKNGTCGLSSLLLSANGRVQGKASRAVLRLATSAAFTAKVVAWTTAQASGDGRRRPFFELYEGVQKTSINEMN